MPAPQCAYCGSPGPATHEHLWPAALHRRHLEANEQDFHAIWLARLQKTLPTEPTLRDVCANCNNGPLSELDSYICGLFDETLVRIPRRHERVVLNYKYHPLKRWLLKMCFNSARIHSSRDLQGLQALAPYILGRSDGLGRSVQVFAELTYPQAIPEGEGPESRDTKALLEPTLNRVGHLYFNVPGVGRKLLRSVHLRAYSFLVALWLPGGSRAEQIDFADVLTTLREDTVLLRPSRASVALRSGAMGAWDSFKHSRSELVFDG
jgi:hypothetical protein